MKNVIIYTAAAFALAAVVYIAFSIMKKDKEEAKVKAAVNSAVQNAADAMNWNVAEGG